MSSSFHRVALVGDAAGIGMLLDAVPRERVACLVAAAIRPQYLEPLGVLSREQNLPLLVQPRRKDAGFAAFLDALRHMDCDSLICNSYSMLLPEEMLRLVNNLAWNFHSALLPRHRGPNPVQWAIIRGETETGISFHQMDAALDSGPVMRQQVIPIHFEDTWLDVSHRINAELPRFVKESVALLIEGRLESTPQDESLATANPRLTPDSPRIDFDNMTDEQIYNLVRAQVAPLAGAYLVRDGVKVRFAGRLSLAEVAALRHGTNPPS